MESALMFQLLTDQLHQAKSVLYFVQKVKPFAQLKIICNYLYVKEPVISHLLFVLTLL